MWVRHFFISVVYQRIWTKLGMKVGLWALTTGKIQRSSYLDNSCYGNEKTFPWLWYWPESNTVLHMMPTHSYKPAYQNQQNLPCGFGDRPPSNCLANRSRLRIWRDDLRFMTSLVTSSRAWHLAWRHFHILQYGLAVLSMSVFYFFISDNY